MERACCHPKYDPSLISPPPSIFIGTAGWTIAGEAAVLTTGQSFIVPSGAIHGCRALEAGRLIDSFTPARLEFL